MLTQDEVKKLVHYDPETGLFTSLKFNRPMAGKNAAGYVQMTLEGQFFYGHRLAWLYVHGVLPRYIDHINGIKSDNRLCNLRSCTMSQNLANIGPRRDNTVGFKGVTKVSWGRYMAQIRVNGKHRCLGHYDTPEEAHAAYVLAAELAFGEFARTT